MARGASQPRPAQEHPPLGPASMETVGKATGDGGVQSPRSGNGRRKMKKKTTPAGSTLASSQKICYHVHVHSLWY